MVTARRPDIRFHSAAVSTSALHAEGPGFEPQWSQGVVTFSLKATLSLVGDVVSFCHPDLAFCFGKRETLRFGPGLRAVLAMPVPLACAPSQIGRRGCPCVELLGMCRQPPQLSGGAGSPRTATPAPFRLLKLLAGWCDGVCPGPSSCSFLNSAWGYFYQKMLPPRS